MNRPRFWFLTALTVAAATSRLLPHPHNVSPMAAVALFGAATFPRRWAAVLVPLGSLLLSDVLLQLTYAAGLQSFWGFYSAQWATYACLAVTAALGFLLRGRRTVPTVAAATLSSSLLFFLVTNFACVLTPGSRYPLNGAGVLLSYQAGLPFFRNTVLGDAFFATVLFGSLALAEVRFPALRPTAAPSAPAIA